ncbi:MAG TPA: methyltransferase [Deltaproteobacteria bacterium]|nr:methyltransferase [Deltaproteobacteria bacterium]
MSPLADSLVDPADSPPHDPRLGAFGARLVLRRPPLCPEFELWLLSDEVELEAGCAELADGEAPPFWAFCWGAGQALARFVLDHPERVRGKRIVDLGTGSGIVALAAARAGARTVLAVDLDPVARHVTTLNARHNGLEIETASIAPEGWDLLLAADVLYENGLRDWILGEARREGPILLADPQRTGTPRLDFPVLDRFEATTFPDVDSPRKSGILQEIPCIRERRAAGPRSSGDPTGRTSRPGDGAARDPLIDPRLARDPERSTNERKAARP